MVPSVVCGQSDGRLRSIRIRGSDALFSRMTPFRSTHTGIQPTDIFYCYPNPCERRFHHIKLALSNHLFLPSFFFFKSCIIISTVLVADGSSPLLYLTGGYCVIQHPLLRLLCTSSCIRKYQKGKKKKPWALTWNAVEFYPTLEYFLKTKANGRPRGLGHLIRNFKPNNPITKAAADDD